MPTTPNRLQIAARIHMLLLRELGQGIVVEDMLANERYARDVLLVCDALRGSELAEQALAYRSATAQLLRSAGAPPGHARQPTEWSRDTSGFGLTQPPPREGEPPPPAPEQERRRGWLAWRRD